MREQGDAMFNTDAALAVDGAMIAELQARAARSSRRRFRICLHQSTDEPVQEMIIAACRDAYCQPHYHPGRSSTFLIVAGALEVVLFDDEGQVTRRVMLDVGQPGGTLCVRLEPGVWHTTICRSEVAVFYETMAGPYRQSESNVYASWSPAEGDAAAEDYLRMLAEKRG